MKHRMFDVKKGTLLGLTLGINVEIRWREKVELGT